MGQRICFLFSFLATKNSRARFWEDRGDGMGTLLEQSVVTLTLISWQDLPSGHNHIVENLQGNI